MFNTPPKFLTSTDVIDIVGSIPKVEKVRKEPVSTGPIIVEEKPLVTNNETLHSFVTDPIEEKKTITKSKRKVYKYSGDDIPWLY